MTRPSDSEPGPLLAHGRAADVYALDDRRVLRRYRAAQDTALEARIIAHVRAHGYPTPAVHDVAERDLVLDRVRGPTMGDDATRRPWTFGASTRTLAALHTELHAIPAPGWLDRAPAGDGPCMVHLDLHPLNVLMSPSGPVVIDWTNAGRGPAEVDIALTWLLLRAGVPEPGHRLMELAAGFGRRWFARAFTRAADRDGTALEGGLARAARFRLTDPTVGDGERRAIARLLAATRTAAG